MTDDFMDFISEEEMQEILAIEEEFGIDIPLDDIFNELAKEDDDDALNWAE